MALGQEQIMQIQVMDWVRFNHLDDFIFHVANERQATPQHGAILKRMGVRAGVSDILCMKPKMSFHGLFIELKVKGGKVSEAQKEFLQTVNSNGYLGVVRWSADEAIETIITYLQL